jgi:glycosyltransferase involved in cell wall biosynthesis
MSGLAGRKVLEGAPFLAAPGDAVALGERIVRLAGDPGLRARLGEAYRRRVAAEFSVQRMCERMTAAIVRQLGPARGQLSPR